MATDDKPTTLHLNSQTSDFNAHQFMIEQGLNRMSKVAIVQITKVTAKGEAAPTGVVSVVPLVKMQDALGNVHAHGAIHNLAYFRLQGGANKAIIMDPKVGDIGVAVFADRDISAAKKKNAAWDGTRSATDAQTPPGSFRKHDMADGMFFGCFLGGKPTCRIQFTDDDKIIFTPDDGKTIITSEKDKIQMKSGKRAVYIRPDRIDIGKLDAPHAVMTVDGPSEKVFAVINEDDDS